MAAAQPVDGTLAVRRRSSQSSSARAGGAAHPARPARESVRREADAPTVGAGGVLGSAATWHAGAAGAGRRSGVGTSSCSPRRTRRSSARSKRGRRIPRRRTARSPSPHPPSGTGGVFVGSVGASVASAPAVMHRVRMLLAVCSRVGVVPSFVLLGSIGPPSSTGSTSDRPMIAVHPTAATTVTAAATAPAPSRATTLIGTLPVSIIPPVVGPGHGYEPQLSPGRRRGLLCLGGGEPEQQERTRRTRRGDHEAGSRHRASGDRAVAGAAVALACCAAVHDVVVQSLFTAEASDIATAPNPAPRPTPTSPTPPETRASVFCVLHVEPPPGRWRDGVRRPRPHR